MKEKFAKPSNSEPGKVYQFLRRNLIIFILVWSLFLLASSQPSTPFPVDETTKSELSEAFQAHLSSGSLMKSAETRIFTPEIDSAYSVADENLVMLWIAVRDDQGKILATEPGLVLAEKKGEEWNIVLPGENGWQELFGKIPPAMLPLELQTIPELGTSAEATSKGILRGYYLPYAGGTSQWLEGSISHFQYLPERGYPSCPIDTCRYAYDFTNDDHFPLVASKEGIVLASRDSCANGNPYCTNYIVLKDIGSNTYQLYLHLAYGTIPDKLTNGTTVKRGQYIGDTDDTGYSTSNHVHFMVVDNLYYSYASQYYWGRSVDIRFEDVQINGGIPRTCFEVTNFQIYDNATQCLGDRNNPRSAGNDWFKSGNTGAYPPTGTLLRPAAGEVVAQGENVWIDVTARAEDDVRVTAVQMQMNMNGVWVDVGPKVTNTIAPGIYDWDVNLCQAAPVNGAMEVALKVWDHEGNVSSGLNPRTIQVDHACPPPVSQINSVDTFDATTAKLNWSVLNKGVGIQSFEVQWTETEGVWDASNNVLVAGSQQSAWVLGSAGKQLFFRMRAIDKNGQAESWQAGDTPEVETFFPGTCTPDQWEDGDDYKGQAVAIQPGESIQRNICGPGDEDWFKVAINDPGYYLFFSQPIKAGAAVSIEVYDENGDALLSKGQAMGLGQAASILMKIDRASTLTIKVKGLYPELMGTDAIYGLRVDRVMVNFLPIISN